MTSVLLGVDRSLRLEERLASKVTLRLADFDGEVFSGTRELQTTIPWHIPSFFLKEETGILPQVRSFFEELHPRISDNIQLYSQPQGNYLVENVYIPFVNGKNLQNILGHDFVMSPYNSVSQSVRRQLGGIFTQMHNDMPLHKKSPVRLLLRLPIISYDIEKVGWERHAISTPDITQYDELVRELKQKNISFFPRKTVEQKKRAIEYMRYLLRDERLANICFFDGKKGTNITFGSYTVDRFDVTDYSGKTAPVTLQEVKTPKEAILAFEKIVQDYVIIAGHNVSSYDNQQLISLKDIHIRGAKLKTKAVLPGQSYVTTASGTLFVDTYGFAKNYAPELVNFKMVNAFEEFTGIKTQKELSYDKLSDVFSKQDLDIEVYGSMDCVRQQAMTKKVLPIICNLAIQTSNDTLSVCLRSPKSIAKDYWMQRCLRESKTLQRNHIDIYRADIGDKSVLFEDFEPHVFLPTCQKKDFGQGVFVKMFPLAYMFEDIVSNREMRTVYDHVDFTTNVKHKSYLLRFLSAIASYPYFKYIDDKRKDTRFSAEFRMGFHQPIASLSQKMQDIQKEYELFFHQVQPICHNNEVLLLPQGKYTLPKGALEIGRGEFIRYDKKTFVMNRDGQLVMMGMSDPQSKRGERCPFERSFIQDFFSAMLIDKNPSAAAELIVARCHNLYDPNYQTHHLEEFVYERIAKKNFFDYSTAAKMPHIEVMWQEEALEGDRICYVLDPRGFYQKLFGEKGSIRTILKPFFSYQNHGAVVADALFSGRGEDYLSDIEDMLERKVYEQMSIPLNMAGD